MKYNTGGRANPTRTQNRQQHDLPNVQLHAVAGVLRINHIKHQTFLFLKLNLLYYKPHIFEKHFFFNVKPQIVRRYFGHLFGLNILAVYDRRL